MATSDSDPADAVSLLQSRTKHCWEMQEVKVFEGFWMERFTADNLQFSTTNLKVYLWGGWLGTHPQLGISEILSLTLFSSSYIHFLVIIQGSHTSLKSSKILKKCPLKSSRIIRNVEDSAVLPNFSWWLGYIY